MEEVDDESKWANVHLPAVTALKMGFLSPRMVATTAAPNVTELHVREYNHYDASAAGALCAALSTRAADGALPLPKLSRFSFYHLFYELSKEQLATLRAPRPAWFDCLVLVYDWH